MAGHSCHPGVNIRRRGLGERNPEKKDERKKVNGVFLPGGKDKHMEGRKRPPEGGREKREML